MLDSGPIGPVCEVIRQAPHYGAPAGLICSEPSTSLSIRIDGVSLAMCLLLAALLCWWIQNWKRHSFPEWWADE